MAEILDTTPEVDPTSKLLHEVHSWVKEREFKELRNLCSGFPGDGSNPRCLPDGVREKITTSFDLFKTLLDKNFGLIFIQKILKLAHREDLAQMVQVFIESNPEEAAKHSGRGRTPIFIPKVEMVQQEYNVPGMPPAKSTVLTEVSQSSGTMGHVTLQGAQAGENENSESKNVMTNFNRQHGYPFAVAPTVQRASSEIPTTIQELVERNGERVVGEETMEFEIIRGNDGGNKTEHDGNQECMTFGVLKDGPANVDKNMECIGKTEIDGQGFSEKSPRVQVLNYVQTDSGDAEAAISIQAINPVVSQCTTKMDESLSTNTHQLDQTSTIAQGGNCIVTKSPPRDTGSRDTGPIIMRKYQLELAKEVLEGHNRIICSPTNSGKTITAGYIFRELGDKATKEKFRSLFIVHIRSLVNQQKESLRKVLLDSKLRVDAVGPRQTLMEVLRHANIVVLTAQIFLNAINDKLLTIQDLDLLFFDECHHTTLKHPYNAIMRKYLYAKYDGSAKLPQIVGLTASLGVGENSHPKEHYLEVCANLACPSVCHVIENREELLSYNPRTTDDQIIEIPSRLPGDPFSKVIKEFMQTIEDRILPNTTSLNPSPGTQHYLNWSVMGREKAEKLSHRAKASAFKTLTELNNTLIFYEDLRAIDAWAYLMEYFPLASLPKEPLEEDRLIHEGYQQRKDRLKELADAETVDQNQMLHQLALLLRRLHTESSEAKGILLTPTRFATACLFKFVIKELKDLVKPERLVGHGKGKYSMTDNEQQEALQKFRKGRANLLIATGVAQEGLDIPKCNYVVRYNFVSDEIGAVQARGRARAKDSECYLIVPEGTGNIERERRNQRMEQLMQEALDELSKEDQNALSVEIETLQSELYQTYLNEDQQQQDYPKIPAEDVKIVCRVCKALVCSGKDIIKKGSHYICADDEYPGRVSFRQREKEREFSMDFKIGCSYCNDPSCQQDYGPVYRYKYHARKYGYGLGIKNVMVQVGDELPYSVKKWSDMNFDIPEEPLGPTGQ